MSGAHRSAARRALITRLVRTAPLEVPDPVIVDVGCDHGHVAAALGAIGTERTSHSLPERPELPRVVADGLAPFLRVDLAVVTGMGPALILRVLGSGPEVPWAVVHSPDRTDELRQRLADGGWRIQAEALPPEGARFAEVLRVQRGEEPHRGHALWSGPLLDGDPHLEAHLRRERARWAELLARVPRSAPTHGRAAGWVAWLDARLQALPGEP